ncbi:hypothetical protein VKT23_006346 [Stygiomarasmius scandens]|uniref:Uncharacterized protein n=1 Tax=Marasmiellus scandens TaxID=2682957 RepID=A0ABR1JQC5_9AGAR
MTTTPATVTFVQPMPIPGSPQAPLFSGKNAKLYLDTIVRHGAAAGISDKDELVDFIYYYSADDIQEVIRYNPDLDIEETTKTWDKAKTAFLSIYQISDTVPDYTLDNLREFVAQHAQRGPYTDKVQIEEYHKSFVKIANVLVKCIPSEWKEWFINECPEEKRQADSALTVAEHQRGEDFSKSACLYTRPLFEKYGVKFDSPFLGSRVAKYGSYLPESSGEALSRLGGIN